MSTHRSRTSYTGSIDRDKAPARKTGHRNQRSVYGESVDGAPNGATLALVTRTSLPADQPAVGAEESEWERERQRARKMVEEWERRRAREEEYESEFARHYERPPHPGLDRRATHPPTDEDTMCPTSRFVNYASVSNQVGGIQYIRDAFYARDTAESAYHADDRYDQEPEPQLYSNGTGVGAQDGPTATSLQQAAFSGQYEVVEAFIRVGADVNEQGGRFGTALQAAAAGRQVRVALLLLRERARVDITGGEFGSALHAAAAAGCMPIITMLLLAGADVKTKAGRHGTALKAATSRRNNEEVTRMLLDEQADATI